MLRAGYVLILMAALAAASPAQQCSTYTTPYSDLQQPRDSTQHTGANSYHYGLLSLNGSCSYAPQSGTTQCAIQCIANVSGGATDVGTLVAGYKHQANDAIVGANAGSNGPQITCGGQVAAAVRSCLVFQPTCDITVTISGSSNGLGGSVSYSSSPLWSNTPSYNFTCGPRSSGSSGQCSPSGGPPYYIPPDTGAEFVWDSATCTWIVEPCSVAGCSSPLLIDTDGSGFQLTSAVDGVSFDFYGTGKPIQIAWTARGSRNGWLALPKDGKITSARDLFGNITPQFLTEDHPANGFAALAVYDDPAYGGNNNGTIDPQDAVWSKLRIWIDSNHDGISQSGELHTLDEIGIKHIDLEYLGSPYVDKYGNHFRYNGHLFPKNEDDDVDRKIFDVFLVTQ